MSSTIAAAVNNRSSLLPRRSALLLLVGLAMAALLGTGVTAQLSTTSSAAAVAPMATSAAVAATTAETSSTSSKTVGKRYVAYFIAWGIYGRGFQPDMIPIEKITHLNYAFANLADDGKLVLGDSYADIDKAYGGDVWDTAQQAFRGNFWQINKVLKKKNPNFKSLISVGGWTWSGKFSTVAASASGRANFAASCAEWVTLYEFDGIDLDWEYPGGGGLEGNSVSPDDGKNYVLLIKEVRAALDALGKGHLLITVASAAGPDKVSKMDIPGMAAELDFLNIMTYDFRGGWSKYTGHQTPLYAAGSIQPPADDPDVKLTDTAAVVKNYLALGFPADKINIGAAFYGRGWQGAGTANNGLYQTFASVPKGTWDDGTSGATGVFDYKDVKKKIAAGELTRFFDTDVKAPWAFSPTTGLMISYDDAESIAAKCAFVHQMGLGGVMIWDLTGDDANELTDAIVSGLAAGSGGATLPPVVPPPAVPAVPAAPAATMSATSVAAPLPVATPPPVAVPPPAATLPPVAVPPPPAATMSASMTLAPPPVPVPTGTGFSHWTAAAPQGSFPAPTAAAAATSASPTTVAAASARKATD